MNNLNVVSEAVVRSTDGSVDVEATKTAFQGLLTKRYEADMERAKDALTKDLVENLGSFDASLSAWVAHTAKWTPVCERFITEVFDSTPGNAQILKPALVGIAASRAMAAGPDNGGIAQNDFTAAQKAFAEYIDFQNGKTLQVDRGRGGGVRRIQK